MPPETVQCVLRNLKLEAFLYCGKIWGMFQSKALKDSKVDFTGDLGDFRIIWECWHFYNGMELTGVFFCFVFFFFNIVPNSSLFTSCYICLANNLTHFKHFDNKYWLWDVLLHACWIQHLTLKHVIKQGFNVLRYIVQTELYTCKYRHVYQQAPTGVILLIYVSVPPRITEIPVRQPSATVGTNLTLTCNASGDPTPNVNWTKEGETAAEFNVSGHKLHLVNVKREDFGSYKCTADNGYGTPATSLAVVNVKCKFYTLILSLLKDKKTQQYIEFRNSHLHQFMQH